MWLLDHNEDQFWLQIFLYYLSLEGKKLVTKGKFHKKKI